MGVERVDEEKRRKRRFGPVVAGKKINGEGGGSRGKDGDGDGDREEVFLTVFPM